MTAGSCRLNVTVAKSRWVLALVLNSVVLTLGRRFGSVCYIEPEPEEQDMEFSEVQEADEPMTPQQLQLYFAGNQIDALSGFTQEDKPEVSIRMHEISTTKFNARIEALKKITGNMLDDVESLEKDAKPSARTETSQSMIMAGEESPDATGSRD